MQHINLICPINKRSYGIASVNILNELSKYAKVSLWPIGGIECEKDKEDVLRQALMNAQSFDYDAPSIRIFHQHSLDCFPGRGERIGFPIFELDTFTEHEKHNLKFPNKLFVCSDWARTIVINNIMPLIKVYDADYIKAKEAFDSSVNVVPLGVDSSIFSPLPLSPGTTTFLNIGKLEKRKGIDILCRAFVDEFKPNEDVALFLSCFNPFLNSEQNEKWMKLIKIDPRIKLIPWFESQHDIATLIRFSDCGVYPSKAEGWNMPALETLSSGRHLIITDYSAHKMYANKDNAMLIDVDRLEEAHDDIWPVFHGQGHWAKIAEKQILQLRLHMRDIHTKKQLNQLSVNDAGIDTAKMFTWNNTAQKILENL